FGIGFILGPAFGGMLSVYGYSVPILAAAALGALNVVYALFRLGESHSENPKVERATRASVLRIPLVRKLCAINFLYTLGVNQLESIFAFFMADRFHYDARHVGYVLALMALIMVAIQGGMIKRLALLFGEKRLVTAGSALLAVAFLLVPESPSVWILLIPLAVSAVGRGISQPSLMSLVSRGGNEGDHGTIMGTFQAAASLARVLGPILAGLLYDRSHALPFFLAFGLLTVVLLLSFDIHVKDARQAIPGQPLEAA
ncbi:MAG: MFS transporter, partial [Deltaproteobacteria bacterium]|nr:MFS transporter [Deltaproteobacteria bacterium]